jgi:formate hydrogenlyase transcriptional activator
MTVRYCPEANVDSRSTAGFQTAFEEIKASDQELRNMVDAIAQTVVVLGPDGELLHPNQALLDYTGLTLEELRSDFHRRFFHPDDVAEIRQRQEGMSRGLPFESERRVRTREGKYRWWLISYRPLRDREGQIIRWYATGTDIDDRKRSEERIRNENVALGEDMDGASMFEEIVGSSPPLQEVLRQLVKVARTESTVLILGETGTGKELVARAIHNRSSRAGRPFVRVNCAAIPSSLIASELFGHERGAFTGALQRRVGRFEVASGGTIFLDEIGELPTETQAALLRVLQEREIERVGSSHPIRVDVRILAATNRDLEAAMEAGSFRNDLFYRLNVFPIRIPPLRERLQDIPILVAHLVQRYAKAAGKRIPEIGRETLELLQSHDWPGNVRELQNLIERGVVLCEDETFAIEESWLRRPGRAPGPGPSLATTLPTTLFETEKVMIESALAESRGRVAGPSGAAARLGIPRSTLDAKIKALGINKFAFRTA